MADQSILNKLQGHELLKYIGPADLEKMAPLCEEVSFPAGQDIFKQYDIAGDVFIIIEGELSLVLCDPKVSCRQIGVVRGGEMLGWSPLIGRHRLSDTAHANTAVTALRLSADKLLKLCESEPSFGYQFMKATAITLAERLGGTRQQLLQVYGTNMPEVQLESD